MTFNEGDWVRICQECGHKQKDNEPKVQGEMTDAYRNRKCKRCKSESLDYGSNHHATFDTDDLGDVGGVAGEDALRK